MDPRCDSSVQEMINSKKFDNPDLYHYLDLFFRVQKFQRDELATQFDKPFYLCIYPELPEPILVDVPSYLPGYIEVPDVGTVKILENIEYLGIYIKRRNS
jgi:hypothetical protein